jgi:hypothetical protein
VKDPPAFWNGLHDHHRDGLRPGRLDRELELLEQQTDELLLGLVGRPVVSIRVPDVDHLGDERLERVAKRRDAVDRERAHGRPVVRDVARRFCSPRAA